MVDRVDPLVPNRIWQNFKSSEKVMGKKKSGIKSLQKLFSAQIQRI